ncbi:MAG: extracellular solute-binding protein [Chloroflexota bacterium]|nr:extracellular solute-binding protein [Chloroflexota bacterium]
MRRFTRWLATLALLPVLAVAGCGGDEEEPTTAGGGGEGGTENTDVSGTVQVTAVWSGAEQESFNAVLDGFREQYPNVTVRYTSGGDQLPTVLATAVEGGNPPDVAVIAQPGLIQEFADQKALKPLDFAADTINENFSEDSVKLGTFNDELYALFFKGANKSTMWFNRQVLEDAGVEPPATWEEFLQAAQTVEQSGVPMHSIGGADGWTLTDLFENLYLRMAGPEKYDELAEHEIPWTDQSVKDTLTEMAKVFENKDNIAGNALQTEFPESVNQLVNGEAATLLEGDFVKGVIEEAGAEQGTYGVEPFPSTEGTENYVVGGGDMVVMFNDTPTAQALVEYLATPEAAEAWASRGGFASPNQNMDTSVYPDEITQTTAGALAEAEVFRFDMSDLAPAEFGGTPGQGEWQILQDFLDDPSNVDRTAQRLERAAARAYK